MNLFKLMQNPEATVVDVRERWEFSMERAEGSINIPLGEVPSRIAEFRNMSKPLILVCRSGNRSGIAAAMLHAQGIEAWNGGAWDDIVAVRQHLAAQKV